MTPRLFIFAPKTPSRTPFFFGATTAFALLGALFFAPFGTFAADANGSDSATFSDDAPNGGGSAPDANLNDFSGSNDFNETNASTAPAFRYWKAPADAIGRWPWGDEKYFPIRVSTFDEWLDATAAPSTPDVAAPKTPGRVSALRLEAKLEGDCLSGFGTLELSSLVAPPSAADANSNVPADSESDDDAENVDESDVASDSAENPKNSVQPAAFPLDSFSFALSSFFEREGARKTSVALYPDARLYVADPKIGEYSFRWSRRGTVDSFGTLAFDLTFPPSPQTELRLETPAASVLSSSSGIVEPNGETDRGTLRWRVFLGGETSTRLTVSGATPSTAPTRRQIGFQQETSTRFSLEGVEVVSRFVFDRSEATLDGATLLLDAPLVPISIDWSGVSGSELGATQTPDAESGATKIDLRAPRRDAGEPLGELKIVAFCPLETNVERRVPAIRLSSDALAWKETLCRLTVVRPLLATTTRPIDAVQARDPMRTPQDGQDFFLFKFFEPTSGVAIKLQAPPSEPAFDSATDASIVGTEIAAKTTLFFQRERADQFRAALPIAPNWKLDSVQASLDERASWSEEEIDGVRSLVVSFKTPPTPDRPARVVVSARRTVPFDGQIAVDALSPFDLSKSAKALRGARALVLRAESPNQIKLSTRSGRPFSATSTAPTPNFLFGEAPIRDALASASGASNVGRLYFGDQTADAVASLENLRSNYSAELSGVGELRQKTFAERWKLRCSPASGSRVDRIVFCVAPGDDKTVASNAPWSWSTSTEPDRLFAATRVSAEETKSLKLPSGVSAFEISLPTSRSVPFELNLFQTIPATREISVPLVFLPEASIKTAEFVVESPLDLPFWTRPDALVPTPTAPAPPNEYESLKSAFRYVPTFAANAPNETNDAPKTPRLAVSLVPTLLDETNVSELPLDVLSANAWCWFATFDEFYESDGTVRRRVSFFIENRGRASILLKTPAAVDGATATRAVWLDDRRVPWSVETLDEKTNGIRVALPPERRFVCVGAEFYSTEPRLGAFRRLKPVPIACDAPVLSAVWNVWTPPEYQFYPANGLRNNDAKSLVASESDADRAVVAFRSIVDFFSFRNSRARKIERVADRFLTRFGDVDALQSSVADARRAAPNDATPKSSANGGNSSSTGGTLAVDAPPTWGDVFGLPDSLERLFAPKSETPTDDAQSATVASTTLETPFGTLEKPTSPFRLYVDRFCLARLRFAPTAPLASTDDKTDPKRRAVRTFADARLVLIFVDDDLALLTTNEIGSGFDAQTTAPVSGADASIRRVKTASDAVRFRRALLSDANPRFVSASAWRSDVDAIGPWRERAREEIAPGWNRTSLSLVQAEEIGVRIADRRVASGVVFLSFLVFLAFVWSRPFAKPAFFVAAFGVCVALQLVAPFDLRLVATGASWGAVAGFGFYFVRFFAPRTAGIGAERRRSRNVPNADRDRSRSAADAVPSENETPSGPSSLAVVVRDETAPPPNRRRIAATSARETAEVDDCSDGSTQGFVDLSKLPPDALNAVVASRPAPSSDDSTPPRAPDRQGAISMKTLAALAATLLFLFLFVFCATAPLPAADDATTPTSAAIASVPTATPEPSANGAASAPNSAADWREPFRVFVPIDEKRETVGDYYWISEELYEQIRETLQSRPRERNWRIVDAKYEGVVNYNSFAETTSLFGLKATYRIFLDAPNATIALPATQLVPDVGAKFDKQALSPIFENGSKEFYFEIVDAEPGEHILELTLAPPQFSEATGQISLPIPRVPTARLELSVPPDAPTLDVPNARGKITRGAGRLAAELGPIDRLVLSKEDATGKSGKTNVDVEQFFLMRTRPTQTDVRAAFRYQVVGEKIDSLQIACDPAFAFSGYCQCDQAEIDAIEPPTAQNGSLRVSFKRPISGSFVLTADFVARNFSGVGQISLPQISTERARVSKNWLALSPTGGVECANLPESTLAPSAFLAAWSGSLDETPIAAFDLSETESGATISLRSTPRNPTVSEATTLVFRPTRVETRFAATLDAPSELFRLELETPAPFVVDAIALTDANGAALQTPTYFLSDDGLSLLFSTPLKGRYSLRIDGGTIGTLDEARPFPTFRIKNAELGTRTVLTYCDSKVYVKRKIPENWVVLDQTRADAAETAFAAGPATRANAYRVGVYEIAPTLAVPLETDAEAKNSGETAPDEYVVRINAPKIAGDERVVLYRKSDDDWRAAVDYRLTVQNGRVERFCVAADDSYSIEPLPADSDFVFSETRLPSGVRALVFEPKKTEAERASFDFQFVATLKSDDENVRLPRFRLLPSTERDDVSDVRGFVFLPKREGQTPVRWDKQNLEKPRDVKSVRNELPDSLAALAQNGVATETTLVQEIPRAVTLDAGLTIDDFDVYEKSGETADASIAAKSDRLQIARAEHSFYWNSRQEYFGASTFAFRSNAPSSCVLIVPANGRLLKTTVDGSRRRAERLDARRWRIDLDGTPFAKRLEISFQGVGAVDSNDAETLADRRDAIFNVEFPRVENGPADETVWACAFDALDGAGPRWELYRRVVGETEPFDVPSRRERLQATREPLPFVDAGPLLFRLGVGRAESLLDAFRTDAALFANSRPDDFARRRDRWTRAWSGCVGEISAAVSPDRPAGSLTERQKGALFALDADVVAPNDDASESTETPLRDLSPSFERWSAARFREILAEKDALDATYRLPAPQSAQTENASATISPQSVWALERGAQTRVLVGLTRENVERIVVVAPPKRFDFFASSWATALLILAATAIVLELLKTDAKTRLFKAVLFGTLGAIGAFAFFFLRWRIAGWLVVALLAVAPPALASLSSRRAERNRRADDARPESFDENADDSAATPLDSTAAFDGPSTETAAAPGPPPAPDPNAFR